MVYIVCIIFLLGCFFIGYKKCEFLKNFFKFSIISLIVLALLEVTLFNFRHFESLTFGDEIVAEDIIYGEGLEKQSDGSYKVVEKDGKNFIEIKGIYKHLDNIYYDFTVHKDSSEIMKVMLGFTDAANERYQFTNLRTFDAGKNSPGELLRMHTSGKTKKIKLFIETIDDADTFTINKISFNKTVPFDTSIIRTMLLFCVLVVIYFFRPGSYIYKMDLFDKKSRKVIALVLLVQFMFMGIASQFNHFLVVTDFAPTNNKLQYQMLAESFLRGHTYLEVEPSETLKNLKNPYDRKARAAAMKESGDDYLWDVAFYNNKYYVYFGVAPVITYYLPYYILTGHRLKTYPAVVITVVAAVIGIFKLIYYLCKRNFKKTNLGIYLAISVLFVNACGLLSIMGRPDHYSLPIAMGIMFSIYGLYWWLKAHDNDLKKSYLFLGSLCMAAVAACRPQLLLTSFFAIPIFWSDIKEGKVFNKKAIGKIISFVTPFIVIAALLMAYNYVRFGSIIDFGANYNLTTNDMTKRGFVFDRTPLGIFYYLFKPINIIPQFPYLMRDAVSTGYLGTTIFEDMGAGFFACNLLAILGLFIFKFKKDFKDQTLYKIGVLSMIFSLIIVIADTQMAGILPRYICDFGYLIYLATIIIVLVLFNKMDRDKQSVFTKIIFYLLIFGLIYNTLLIISDSSIVNSDIFYYLRRLVEFWR